MSEFLSELAVLPPAASLQASLALKAPRYVRLLLVLVVVETVALFGLWMHFAGLWEEVFQLWAR